MITISIIGSGNVATNFTRFFNALSNVEVEGLYVRKKNPAKSKIEGVIVKNINNSIPRKVDFVIICISDSSIGIVSKKINLLNRNTIVLHTSGSTSTEELNNHNNYGVLYPLQTISKNTSVDFTNVPFFINSNSSRTADSVKSLCKVSDISSTEMTDAKRKKLHLTAVMANNFCNYILGQTKSYAEENDINFQYFKPLMQQTIDNLFDPKLVFSQTGPAIRNDRKTINAHLELLDGNALLEDLYRFLSEQILKSKSN